MSNVAEKATIAAKTRPVRIDVDLLSEVEQERQRLGRTLSGQVEHWVRLGRAFEAMPGLTVAQQRMGLEDVKMRPEDFTDNVAVIAALYGERGILDLAEDERILFDDVLAMLVVTPALERGFAQVRKENAAVRGNR